MGTPSTISVSRATTEWLYGELSTLTPQEWETPNACGVWSVAEVGAHLALVGQRYRDGVRRALADDSGPPPGETVSVDRAGVNARIAAMATAYRQELGDRVFAVFSQANLSLVELFERLTPMDWDRPAYHPAGVRPVRRLLAMHIVEVCVHGWDMLHSLGRDIVLPDACYRAIVDTVPGSLQGRFVPRERLPEPERYLFALGSPVSSVVRLTVHGDRFEIGPAVEGSGSDAVLTMQPLTYVLLFLGRLNWRQAIDEGALAVTGRQDLAGDLPSWFGLA